MTHLARLDAKLAPLMQRRQPRPAPAEKLGPPAPCLYGGTPQRPCRSGNCGVCPVEWKP